MAAETTSMGEKVDTSDKIANGAIFCQVANSAHCRHGKLAMTLGNHQWAGAAPSLIIILIITKITIVGWLALIEGLRVVESVDAIIIALPTV